jgi:hypothetical protein
MASFPPDAPRAMDVTMLLCDAAQEAGGKLFVLGGGWSVVLAPNVPISMALAIKLSIPWDQANQPHPMRAALITDDGEPVTPEGAPAPITAEGVIEVGRPDNLKPGTPIDAPFVLNFGFVALAAGGYVWELEIDGVSAARTPFRVMG